MPTTVSGSMMFGGGPDGRTTAGVVNVFNYKIEDLAQGGDITARAFFQAPRPCRVLDARIIPEAASTGVDGSNTLLVQLYNITQSAAVAAVTRTADLAANTPVALTVAASAAEIEEDDVLGIVVTQGTTANAGTFVLQVTYT